MLVDKFHENISLKQSKWLEIYISFNSQKKILAIKDFERVFFYKLSSNAFYGKTLENVRNRVNLEFVKKTMGMMK